ncbi:facilitated trehalose transporter Tret1-2 homolog isoform X2 [Condylostylus longicornis]|uniref:facilitated trehalose transporter Tret1-2 homolog isoform X2 n=1 Tax=Condylostylus longicornis TaxID=2530218 RepID=UPI00244DC48E|nr:facilitated trehalose transporter Tret1-2 homolog isoform X2 [Condylostylus longicornis]
MHCCETTISLEEQENLIKEMGRTSNAKTFPQYIAAAAAAGGALAAGVCLGWTSLTEKSITEHNAYGFEVTDEQFSWVGSFFNLGAASICIPIGFLISAIGRKLSMLLLVLPFTIGWALLIWASNVEMMWAARFILGVSGGAFCVTAPMYTGEIASKEIRGTLGSFFQLMITIGILLAYILGWLLEVFPMSLICGAVPILFGLIFVFMPETPTYLVSKGNIESAQKSIKWLRGADYDHTQELSELQIERDQIKNNKVNFFAAMSRPVTIKALFISLGLMSFQQLSGINAVIFYTGGIFKDADTGIDLNLATILVGVMQVIATTVSVLVVDRLGRRILLLISGAVMAICTILLGVYFYMKSNDASSVQGLGWLPVTCLCLFIIVFSLGYGPVPWLMMGELFPTDIKGVAGSIAGTFNWVLAFIITKTFVNLKDALGQGETFWLFAGLTVIGCVFVAFCVPETKGKSLAEIQQMLGDETAGRTTSSSKQ